MSTCIGREVEAVGAQKPPLISVDDVARNRDEAPHFSRLGRIGTLYVEPLPLQPPPLTAG